MLITRAMLPSALSVSPLFGGSVHYEIRFFGPALQSHKRSLCKEAKSVCAVTEIRSDRIIYVSPSLLGSLRRGHRLLSLSLWSAVWPPSLSSLASGATSVVEWLVDLSGDPKTMQQY